MVLIRFRSVADKRRALGLLAGRFSFTSWGSGPMRVDADALPFLADHGIVAAIAAEGTDAPDLPTARGCSGRL